MKEDLELLGLNSSTISLLVDAADRNQLSIGDYVDKVLTNAAGYEYALQQIASSKE